MTHYICIAIGMADCTPTEQHYFAAETGAELQDIVGQVCASFDNDANERGEEDPYHYDFRVPLSCCMNNYTQRLRISRDADWVLDVIGMTEDEYNREMGGE